MRYSLRACFSALALIPGFLAAPMATAAPTRVAEPGIKSAAAETRAGTLSEDPSQPGTFEVTSQEILSPDYNLPLDCDLYRPTKAGNYPAIVLGHGFSQYKDYQHDNAMQLASWGMIVLVPTFGSSDHEQNGENMLLLLDWLTSGDNPYRDQVDETRLGVAGHSAGGLATVVAAGLDAVGANQVSAAVTLDAVDVVQGPKSTGQPYAEDITAPILFLAGIPYDCNSDGNSQGMYDKVPSDTDRMYLRITKAVHCDFNDQDIDHACTPDMKPAGPVKVAILLATQGWPAAYDAFTAGVCSVEDQEVDRTDEILLLRKYMTAWFLARLLDQTWAEPYLYDGSEVQADQAAGVIQDVQF